MKKSIEYRLKELETSINAIAFSFDNYMMSGNDMHLLTIKTQLRALIATGGRNMKPLLLELAGILKIDIFIYCLDRHTLPNDFDLEDKDAVVIDVPLSKTWSTKMKDGYTKFSFKEWMQYPDYSGLYTQGYVSRNKILREIADTSGSHFDEDIKELVEYIDSPIVSIVNSKGELISKSGLCMFLLDIASATCWIGRRLLLKVNKKFDLIKSLDDKYDQLQWSSTQIHRLVLLGKIVQKDSFERNNKGE